jgi:RND family efflux transporter MFP subunit
MRHNRSFIQLSALLLTALALAGGTAGCSEAESAAATVQTSVDTRVDVPAHTVATADIESSLQISGSLVPQARVNVMSKLPGTLARVAVDIGDAVRAGQIVAVLDRREIDAQVDAAAAAVHVAEAAVESAEAALANAAVERERAANLFEKGAVPRQRLDAADTANRAAAAQRDLARANLAQTKAAARRTHEIQRDATLVSPITGVVVERNFDAGSLVSSNDKAIVAVADLRVLKLQAGVSELEAGRFRVGMPARITVQARPGDVFDGRVTAIAPEVDAKNRHFAVEVRTLNPGNTLLSGMYGVATIPLARAEHAVAVPRDALTTRSGKRVALKIDNQVVTEVPVTEGLSNGRLVQIASGLAPGDVIVADARRDVAAGTRVNAILGR